MPTKKNKAEEISAAPPQNLQKTKTHNYLQRQHQKRVAQLRDHSTRQPPRTKNINKKPTRQNNRGTPETNNPKQEKVHQPNRAAWPKAAAHAHTLRPSTYQKPNLTTYK
ncbi:hypothetical protein Ancab_029990 [Ancistrocladus abbreviatus]